MHDYGDLLPPIDFENINFVSHLNKSWFQLLVDLKLCQFFSRLVLWSRFRNEFERDHYISSNVIVS